ncbi:MAG: ABC transporter substrate-binding protein [Actinobacteria bacterium]|nr:ABC transporter substrate-binding protein [Actinomycetota bacterium]MBI3687973.1 ABC transporter substrate-binding protein [Actinomycetota bacterium]
MRLGTRGRWAAPALVAVAAVVLAGCGTTVSKSPVAQSTTPSCTPGTPASGVAAPASLNLNLAADPALAAKVPAKYKTAGQLVIATDASYAPNEFTDSSGAIIGMDVDLGNALGQLLGLKVKFVNTSFDGILAGIAAGRYDASLSSFTDTKEREKIVDFITYFTAGTSIMAKKCNPLGIATTTDLCGKTVAAENGTTQLDSLTKEDTGSIASACKTAGKAAPVAKGYPKQTDVNAALAAGRVDAYIADSPVVAYAVKVTGDAFQMVGDTMDVAPYGMAVTKSGGTLKDALLGAVSSLVSSGDYKKILDNWGVSSGAVGSPQLNGAQS